MTFLFSKPKISTKSWTIFIITAFSLILAPLLFSANTAAKNEEQMKKILGSNFNNLDSLRIVREVRTRLAPEEISERTVTITRDIQPWITFEKLSGKETARAIATLNKVSESGLSFEDLEELIPVYAHKDMTPERALSLALSNNTLARAGYIEGNRYHYLDLAEEKSIDNSSLIAGARALALTEKATQRSGIDNFSGSIPKKGNQLEPSVLSARALEAAGVKAGKAERASIEQSVAGIRALEAGEIKMRRHQVDWDALENSLEGRTKILLETPKTEKETSATSWKVLSQKELLSTINPWVGTPYRYGGLSKSGIDCSGFTLMVLTNKSIGVPKQIMPHGNQSNVSKEVYGTRVPYAGPWQAGDLVFYSASPGKKKITHVGLVISSTEFYHASSSRGVVKDNLEKNYYKSRRLYGRRVFNKLVD